MIFGDAGSPVAFEEPFYLVVTSCCMEIKVFRTESLKNEAYFQSPAALIKSIAEGTDAESRVFVGRAKITANLTNDFADCFSLFRR